MRPACAEADPQLFDQWKAPDQALAYCDKCPIRLWCLRQVQPATSYFDGVAGGIVWHEGRYFRRGKDQVLSEYLRNLPKNGGGRSWRKTRNKTDG